MMRVATILGLAVGVWFGVRIGVGFPVILLWALALG